MAVIQAEGMYRYLSLYIPLSLGAQIDKGRQTSTARIKPSGRTVASHARTRITVETKKPLKPKLPSRLATGKAQSQVAPDSLSISAQLVPWIFMRSSLDAQLRSLEGQFEAESDRLDRLEKDREDQKQKMELGAQIDMLEDLSRPENQSFTSQLIQVLNDARNLFSDTDSPQSLTVSAGKLALLQDRVHSDDWDPQIFEEISAQLGKSSHYLDIKPSPFADEMTKQATALQSSLLALSSKLDESLVLKASSHWENILRELAWLLQTRIASLEELSNAIPLVEAYQRARIELEVLKIGFP
ncbi:hypothetical protein FRC17_000566 [Serendipita sp. 399]|nr:hypothetical protein FRC17_000566 [Serendipita sp. 399]